MQLENFFINKIFFLLNTNSTVASKFLHFSSPTYFFYFEPIQRYNNKLFLKIIKQTKLVIYNNELQLLLKIIHSVMLKFLLNNVRVAFLFNNPTFSESLNYIFLPKATYTYCRLNNFFNVKYLIKKNKLKHFLFFRNFFKINVLFFFIFNLSRTHLKFIKNQATVTLGLTSLNSGHNIFTYNFPIIINFNFTMFFFKSLVFNLYLLNNTLK